jgi:hypothetical protein
MRSNHTAIIMLAAIAVMAAFIFTISPDNTVLMSFLGLACVTAFLEIRRKPPPTS